MKGWWKMAICRLKHSYLNWRKFPYRRKMVCVYAFFHHFFQFMFWLKQISQVYNMTINFSFSFIHLFFFIFREWSILGNIACRRWPSSLKHLFSCEDLFWKGWLLVRGCSYHFCPEKKYGSKVFSRNGQFLVNVPWGINQGDFKASRSWDLCFLVIEKVW